MSWTWLALAGLGAGHGLNPGMGWLFAVALGMQEGRTRAVWRALSPLALGHALAVGAAVLAAAALGQLLPAGALHWIVGGLLLGLGALRLLRHRHPRYGGMRVGFRELTTWSFLMATAHGAGLMVLPLLIGDSGGGNHSRLAGAHAMHLAQASVVPVSGPLGTGLWATAMHSAGYLLVTGLIAVVVYRKVGLRMLRTMWINLDLIWGGALIVTGAVALLAGGTSRSAHKAINPSTSAERGLQTLPISKPGSAAFVRFTMAPRPGGGDFAKPELPAPGPLFVVRTRSESMMKPAELPAPVDRATAQHYRWGVGCHGWHLVREDGLSVIAEHMPPGTAEVRHRHRRAQQFFLVLAGELTVERNGSVTVLPIGSGVHVPAGVAHEVRNAGAGPAEFLVISQPPSHADREYAEQGRSSTP